MKYLLVIAVVVGVLWLLAVQRRRQRGREDDAAGDRGPAAVKPAASRPDRHDHGPSQMVRCAHCGVHLPQPEALTVGALHYCSPAHRDAGPQHSR